MKKIFAVLLIVSLLLIVGCDGVGSSTQESTTIDSTTDDNVTDEPTGKMKTVHVTVTHVGDGYIFGRAVIGSFFYDAIVECDTWHIDVNYTVSLEVDENNIIHKKGRIEISNPYTMTVEPPAGTTWEKPVIYLYPEEEMEISVNLDFQGKFIITIPEYQNGWTVTASPDGTIRAKDGKTYPYLFWEGIPSENLSITEGFCVEGADTKAFLLEALPKLGLIEHEYNEFIEFWLPRMEDNAYNLIQFQTEAYTNMAPLDISPEPDSVIRVFMTFKAVSEYTEIPKQELPTDERHGFAVIEWGGSELK